MHWSDYTNYPEFAGKTYWGGFRSVRKDGVTENEPNQDVVLNRNLFYSMNRIKSVNADTKLGYRQLKYMEKVKTGNDSLTRWWIDHVEWYYTKDDTFIVITSPYCKCGKEPIPTDWVKIPSLYHADVDTYMITFTKDDIKRNMDKVKRRIKEECKRLNKEMRSTPRFSSERHRQIMLIDKNICPTCTKEFEECVC